MKCCRTTFVRATDWQACHLEWNISGLHGDAVVLLKYYVLGFCIARGQMSLEVMLTYFFYFVSETRCYSGSDDDR